MVQGDRLREAGTIPGFLIRGASAASKNYHFFDYTNFIIIMDVHLSIDRCVNCGFCCRLAPCGWGEVTSPTDRACRFLIPGTRPGRWLCGKYNEIVGQPTSEFSPAFGAGCCSNLNSYRRKIIKEEHAHHTQKMALAETQS